MKALDNKFYVKFMQLEIGLFRVIPIQNFTLLFGLGWTIVRIASNNFISISYRKFLFDLITSFKFN